MREVELKSVVDDEKLRRSLIEQRGAARTFSGKLIDVRYDAPALGLALRDQVLRLRVYETSRGSEAHIDWKGETRYESGFKVREEISSRIGDAAAFAAILGNIGFIPIRAIEREIEQYELAGAVIRFERYPRMDVLVEVEGEPEAIENAIEALGIPRQEFTAERLVDFVARYEVRTGQRAALTAAELKGDYTYSPADA
ncbi:MAG TPA: class IV adenylate cyclase [Gemmatimonadaceae bacterium]|nr:class IV adenylate cyclase [Gemmatimonadaceae bacterium]